MKRAVKAGLTFGGAVSAAALFGSMFSPGRGGTRRWYRKLDKPPFNPPDAVFPIVWTTLYALMAVSAYRVSQHGKKGRGPLRLWWLQLALNAAWSPIFFGAKRPGIAMVDLVALLGALLAYAERARHVDRLAAGLMIPYIVWTGYAGAINAEVVRRN